MAYQQMAAVYDRLMGNAPYDEWVNFTELLIEKLEMEAESLVDLGCGTGQITTRLARKGYNLTGVDNSADMLSYAEQHASEENLQVRWIHQDLKNLEGIVKQDIAVSYCDVINYITDEQDLLRVFSNVFALLRPGGVFLFDVHSMKQVSSNFVNQTFTENSEDVSYIWECSEGETKGDMYHDLSFFVKNGEHYKRFDEYHHQRTYPVEKYQGLLEQSGFEVIHVSGDFSTENGDLSKDSERIFIGAAKRSEK